MKLSKEAQSALLAAHSRTGSTVYADVPTTVELTARGLVSPRGNLTEAGKSARERIARQREDEAFG